jgi:hypothetical protein
VLGSCEHRNELSRSIKHEELFDLAEHTIDLTGAN